MVQLNSVPKISRPTRLASNASFKALCTEAIPSTKKLRVKRYASDAPAA